MAPRRAFQSSQPRCRITRLQAPKAPLRGHRLANDTSLGEVSCGDRLEWPNAPLELVRPDERMFRTQLIRGAKERPNFAGHYRFVGWGCGSACAAGAFIDLQTGEVHPPPRSAEGHGWERWMFAGGFVDGPYIEMRPDSRLVITREQAKDPASQEVQYYEWLGTGFRLLNRLTEKKSVATTGPAK
jgi:hypothetical protein